MREASLLRTAAILGLFLACSDVASAQEDSRRFLGIDPFFVLFGRYVTDDREERWKTEGWKTGASVRILPWLGITGAFGSLTIDRTPTRHFMVGPQFTTRYSDWSSRYFAFALVGRGYVKDAVPSRGGGEVVVGGGIDLFGVVRVQGEYIRLTVDGLRDSTGRALGGVVVPLCLRRCGQFDGINASGQTAQP